VRRDRQRPWSASGWLRAACPFLPNLRGPATGGHPGPSRRRRLRREHLLALPTCPVTSPRAGTIEARTSRRKHMSALVIRLPMTGAIAGSPIAERCLRALSYFSPSWDRDRAGRDRGQRCRVPRGLWLPREATPTDRGTATVPERTDPPLRGLSRSSGQGDGVPGEQIGGNGRTRHQGGRSPHRDSCSRSEGSTPGRARWTWRPPPSSVITSCACPGPCHPLSLGPASEPSAAQGGHGSQVHRLGCCLSWVVRTATWQGRTVLPRPYRAEGGRGGVAATVSQWGERRP
jgi:hypothetical protein